MRPDEAEHLDSALRALSALANALDLLTAPVVTAPGAKRAEVQRARRQHDRDAFVAMVEAHALLAKCSVAGDHPLRHILHTAYVQTHLASTRLRPTEGG